MPKPPTGFDRFKQRAQQMLARPEDILRAGDGADAKLKDTNSLSRKFSAIRMELADLIALVKAYARGDYRDISGTSFAVVLAAVLYFLSPIDVLPDFILGLGLVDDAAIVAYVVKLMREEIEQFRQYKRILENSDD